RLSFALQSHRATMHRREFVHRSAWAVAAYGILRQVGACRPGAPAAGPTATASPFATLRDRYFLRTLELNPVVATYLGECGTSPTGAWCSATASTAARPTGCTSGPRCATPPRGCSATVRSPPPP